MTSGHLWTSVAGTGPPLVFCHGGPGLWDYFDDLAPMFHDTARTVRWDQRGCGRSQRSGPYTIDRFVADLDVVRGDADRIALLGHSWGALLALRYALAHPARVSHLIYVSGTGVDPGEPWRPAYHRALESRPRPATDDERERAIQQWTADYVDPATARAHATRLATPWFGIAHECARAINDEAAAYLDSTDVPALCRTLKVPTLIIDGAHDIRPRWAVDSLEKALPDVRRVVLPGAGHNPWAEDPAGFHKMPSLD